MKLIDLVEDIDNIDGEAIIFQEDIRNLNSDIILSFSEEEVKDGMGRRYQYLIEVFLQKSLLRTGRPV